MNVCILEMFSLDRIFIYIAHMTKLLKASALFSKRTFVNLNK